MSVLDPIYRLFNYLFAGLYENFPPRIVIMIFAVCVSTLIVTCSKLLTDQNRIRDIKQQMSKHKEQMAEARKTGNARALRKLQARQKRVMMLQSEMMGLSMKPLLVYSIPLMLFFFWLNHLYSGQVVMNLPFNFPFMGFFHRNNTLGSNQFGFVAWYFFTVSTCSMFIKKVMRVS